MSVTTTIAPEVRQDPHGPPEHSESSPRIANSWLRRLRRRLRYLVTSPPPANDAWAPAGGPVVVVAPHPDDEVIGCGGTIRRHARAGDRVTVIYLTRGENSRGYPWLSPAQKRDTRMKEARASCAVLGVTDTVFLDGIDGNLSDPASLADLSAKVAAAVRARCPRVIYVPHAGDNHPDHIAAYRVVVQIARDCLPAPAIYQYELWSPLAADFAIDISSEMRAKVKAIKCHQLALDAFDYVPTMIGLAAYRSGTLLQRRGYAEAFRRSPEIHHS